MAVSEALLRMIANPTVVSPAGQFRAGARQRVADEGAKADVAVKQQQVANAPLAKQGLQADLAAKQQKITKEGISQAVNYVTFAASPAFKGNLPMQDAYLAKGVEQVSGNPQAVAIFNHLQNLKTPEQRQAAYTKLGQWGQQAGFLEPLSKGKDLRAVAPTPTNEDDYVALAEKVWTNNPKNKGKPFPPENAMAARMEHKRTTITEAGGKAGAKAQAKADVELATVGDITKAKVEAELAAKIKYQPGLERKIAFNEQVGKDLGIIKNAAKVIEAKGEVTPVQKQQNAKNRLTGDLATLADHYVTLDSTKSIVNIENSTTENLLASLKSSTLGQAFGKRIGTSAQSIRNAVNNLRPLLLQEIRQSTDMGARGLDSEKELEFYMQAATNEKQDIQSNIAAIVVLDEAYGTGEIADKMRGLTTTELIEGLSSQGATILKGKASPPEPAGAVLNFDAQGNLIP